MNSTIQSILCRWFYSISIACELRILGCNVSWTTRRWVVNNKWCSANTHCLFCWTWSTLQLLLSVEGGNRHRLPLSRYFLRFLLLNIFSVSLRNRTNAKHKHKEQTEVIRGTSFNAPHRIALISSVCICFLLSVPTWKIKYNAFVSLHRCVGGAMKQTHT